jgi:hypothetical protein
LASQHSLLSKELCLTYLTRHSWSSKRSRRFGRALRLFRDCRRTQSLIDPADPAPQSNDSFCVLRSCSRYALCPQQHCRRKDRASFSYLRLSAIVCPKGSRGRSIESWVDRARWRNARLALHPQEDAVPGSCSSHCRRPRSPSGPSIPPQERAAVDQLAAGMAPQERRKFSILASTDEMSNQPLANSAIYAQMLTAFVAMSRSRPASDSPVYPVRRLFLVSIACVQTRDSD